MILNYDDLLALMAKHFSNETAGIGRSSLEAIIDDFTVLGADKVKFEQSEGGHNYGIVENLGLIVGILQLLVAAADIIVRELRSHKEVSSKSLIEAVKPEIEKSQFPEITQNEQVFVDLIIIIRKNENQNK